MEKGKFYEIKAIEFLRLKGYEILECNFRSRFGEIDIVAQDNKFTSFVEVKARAERSFFSPQEAVDEAKKAKIRKTALFYTAGRADKYYRFDVLEIIQGQGWRQYNLIKDAFNMDEQS